MSTINYAIEITTSATTVSDSDYGCINGVFRWITGRPGYDGTPTYPTGETGIGTGTLQARWYEGWLREDALNSPNRAVDISLSGTYGSMSGFRFALVDAKQATRMWKFIRDNDIYTVNRPITLYVVIDDVFYYAWSGVITNSPHNESDHSFQCKDSFRKIHQTIPRIWATKTNFEDAPEGDSAKPIPIVMGDVTYSRLLPETSDVEYKTLCSWYFNEDGRAAPAHSIGIETVGTHIYKPYIDLWTYPNSAGGDYHTAVIFTEDELGDGTHYLRVAKATDDDGSDVDGVDREYMIRIIGNNATIPDSTLDGWNGAFNLTRIYLSDSVREGGGDQDLAGYNWIRGRSVSYQNNIGVPESVWYFNIVRMALKLYISESDIVSLLTNETTGLPFVYVYNKDTDDYEDVSYLVSSLDLSPADGKPYILLNRDSMSIEGSARLLTYYKPVTVVATKNVGTPTDITSIMTDKTRVTYAEYAMVANPTSVYTGDRLDLDIEVPAELLSVSCDKIWLTMDWTASLTTGGYTFLQINPYPNHFGIFVREGVDSDKRRRMPMATGLTGTYYPAMLIPNEYYDVGGNTGGYSSNFNNYTLDGGEYYVNNQCVELDQAIIDGIKDGTYINKLRLRLTLGGAGSLRLRQLVFTAQRVINLTSEAMYVRVKGEQIVDVGQGVQSNNVYGAFRLMLENYDELDFADVDYNNLSTTRQDWHIGRTIDQRKSSFDYIKELCEQSFVALFPTRSGMRRLTAWREDTTSVATHDETTIVRGSLGDYELSEISQLYNSFFINYSWDDGRSEYTSMLYVDSIFDDAFPPPGGTGVYDWKSYYVGGLPEACYADAKALWEVCHASYVRAQVISSQLPTSVTDLDWYTDISKFDPSETRWRGTDSSAWKFMVNLAEWTTRQKEIISYSLPMTAANIQLELLNPVTFSDTVYTASDTRTGWITKIELDLKRQTVDVELTLNPWDIINVGDSLIEERGSVLNTDTITERGDQVDDTVTEQGV